MAPGLVEAGTHVVAPLVLDDPAGRPGASPEPGGESDAAPGEDSRGERARVLVAAAPLVLDDLEARPQAVRRSGYLDPPGSRRVTYPAAPAAAPGPARRVSRRASPPVVAVRLRLTGRWLPTLEQAVAVADAARGAALKRLDREGTGRPSVALSGRTPDGDRADDDHRHAHYLAFPSAGGRGVGRPGIDTVVVWVPDGFDDVECDALAGIAALRPPRGRGNWQVRVAAEAGGITVEGVAEELAGPSAAWRSLTPYAAPRHLKRRYATWEDQAADRLCRDLVALPHVGPALAEAAAIEPDDRLHGAGFVRHRPSRERRGDDRRAAGFTVRFPTPVTGPIAVGALRHFGLGLFVPTGAP